jgi:hypothetical protein
MLKEIKFYNSTTPTTVPTKISYFSQPVDARNVPPSLLSVHWVAPLFF